MIAARSKFFTLFLSVFLSVTGLFGATLADSPTAAAATNPNCTTNGPDPSLGTSFVTYTIPTAGTYTIWSRLLADAAANNAYYLQIDCGAPITVGGASLTAGTWTWVNYKDGTSTSKITATLTAGSHTFNLTGKSPNLMLDRVIFASDAACVPTGTGDNCAAAATPTPSPGATPTPTTTGLIGDANADGKVNVTDLSLLLSHWATTYAPTDFNHDGTTNVTDLSLLLSHWTG
jgi:hypothetical protein